MNQDVANFLLEKYGKKNPPALRPGETVRVHQRIKEGNKERVQIFEGLVIAVKHGNGLNGSFTVRKIAAGGIGVERTYPVHSPNIVKVERTKVAEVSRAKLYYMRDRQGKSARFKKETRSAQGWEEKGVEVVEEPMVPGSEVEVPAEEMMPDAVEETVETPVAEVEEAAPTSEEVEEEKGETSDETPAEQVADQVESAPEEEKE